ncbi:MAG TPA: hypothetical protein VJW76_07335, partial [Verrucomicrobiae bacterium]|nr:hypothetical protein [Verrucomicrobiae bacterium]
MKTNRRWFALWLAAFSVFSLGYCASASPDQPVITSVRLEDTNVVVAASVPAGIKRVTLECRSRVGAGSWAPRALTRLDGSGGDVTFRIPRSGNVEMLRVRADDHEPLPVSFYSGQTTFDGQPNNSGGLT